MKEKQVPSNYIDDPNLPQLRVGTGWTEIELKSEVGVRLTQRGYTPCIRVERAGFPHLLYASAVSLGKPLEEVRKVRGGSLSGCRLRIRKAGTETTSPYELEIMD
jgi:hypothetical protein